MENFDLRKYLANNPLLNEGLIFEAISDDEIEKAAAAALNVSIDDPKLLEQFGIIKKEAMTIRDLWTFLIEQISHNLDHKSQLALEHILKNGSLSERIINASCNDFSKDKLKFIYRQLGECLVQNQQF